jgi:hypothetical protein
MCVGSGSRLILSMRFDTLRFVFVEVVCSRRLLMRAQGPTVRPLQMV